MPTRFKIESVIIRRFLMGEVPLHSAALLVAIKVTLAVPLARRCQVRQPDQRSDLNLPIKQAPVRAVCQIPRVEHMESFYTCCYSIFPISSYGTAPEADLVDPSTCRQADSSVHSPYAGSGFHAHPTPYRGASLTRNCPPPPRPA